MTRDKGPADGSVSAGTQRLDKWLWFARVAKSRTLASALVTGGKIRVNKIKTDKPSYAVRVGDVITSSFTRDVRVLEVAGLGVRRGPPPEAQALYKELTVKSEQTKSDGADSSGKVAAAAWGAASGLRSPGSGRPTKRERREIDRLKDQN